MSTRFQHANSYLRGNAKTGELLAAIESNLKLLQSIRSKLPAPLDEHCLHASLEEGVLTLVTDSSVWGSRLRFFSTELSHALGSRHGTIESCRIRVHPAHEARPRKDPGPGANRMSQQTVKLLLEAANALGESELARALRRLAKAGEG
jgi:hypothetical protein